MHFDGGIKRNNMRIGREKDAVGGRTIYIVRMQQGVRHAYTMGTYYLVNGLTKTKSLQ